MDWIVGGFMVLVICTFVLGNWGVRPRSILAFIGIYFLGMLLGALGMIILGRTVESIVAPPRMEGFDELVFPLYIGPMGALLGGLSTVIYYRLRQGKNHVSRRLFFVCGGLLLSICLWATFGIVRIPEQYLSGIRNAAFWLFAYGFPILWFFVLAPFVWSGWRSPVESN